MLVPGAKSGQKVGWKMENIETKIIGHEAQDSTTVELNGVRQSRQAAIQCLKELAKQLGGRLFDQKEVEQAEQEYADAVNQETADEAYRDGEKEGYKKGFKDGQAEGDADAQKHTCANCRQELCTEAVERLSDKVSPVIDVKDIANVLFELHDYNEWAGRARKAC